MVFIADTNTIPCDDSRCDGLVIRLTCGEAISAIAITAIVGFVCHLLGIVCRLGA